MHVTVDVYVCGFVVVCVCGGGPLVSFPSTLLYPDDNKQLAFSNDEVL